MAAKDFVLSWGIPGSGSVRTEKMIARGAAERNQVQE